MKLSPRWLLLLEAVAKYGVSDTGGDYYCLGGHGVVLIRFDQRTLPGMRDAGLVFHQSYWRVTEAGQQLYAEITRGDHGSAE